MNIMSNISTLIMPANEFQDLLNKQINKGKALRNRPYNRYINEYWTFFIPDYQKWAIYNSELLKRAFNSPNNPYIEDYEYIIKSYKVRINNSDMRTTEYQKMLEEQITYLESMVERIGLFEIKNNNYRPNNIDNKKIFIVHGHDEALKVQVESLILQLGLQPIILHKQANKAKTLIEKFEDNSDVGCAIVLFTPDDTGKANMEKNYKPRARQNVVFEMGYFIGRLGRERTISIAQKEVELPGDLEGTVYIDSTNGNDWKYEICKELQAMGYNVSKDQIA